MKNIFIHLSLVLLLSSCSNFFTWHLDLREKRGLDTGNVAIEQKKETIRSNISVNTQVNWYTNVNKGASGFTDYLRIVEINDIFYMVDSYGLLSAIDKDGDIQWSMPVNVDVSSGLSVIDNMICIGSNDARLLCYDVNQLSLNKHTTIISSINNAVTFDKLDPKLEMELITELSSPVINKNSLLLLKLDNDDIFMIDSMTKKTLWESRGQNIPLKTKGSSMPLIDNDTVIVARDNGSISSYNILDGTLNWFSIISSRSGRNDLEAQRDAEMNIAIVSDKIIYGHYQGSLTLLDQKNGQTIWASPFSFVNDIVVNNNSIYGSTSDNYVISIDLASGFLNWKYDVSNDKVLSHPVVIDDIIALVTTDGDLMTFDKELGTLISIKETGFEFHQQVNIINHGKQIYIQTLDGKLVNIEINRL